MLEPEAARAQLIAAVVFIATAEAGSFFFLNAVIQQGLRTAGAPEVVIDRDAALSNDLTTEPSQLTLARSQWCRIAAKMMMEEEEEEGADEEKSGTYSIFEITDI